MPLSCFYLASVVPLSSNTTQIQRWPGMVPQQHECSFPSKISAEHRWDHHVYAWAMSFSWCHTNQSALWRSQPSSPLFKVWVSNIFTFYFFSPFFSKGDPISKRYFNGRGIKSIQLRRISFGEILLYCFLARKPLLSTFLVRWGRLQAFY